MAAAAAVVDVNAMCCRVVN